MAQNTSHAVMSQRSEAHPFVSPTSAAEARLAGLKWYVSTNPCPQGHISKRNVSNYECRACVQEKQKRQRAAGAEKWKAKDAARWAKDVEGNRKKVRERYVRHAVARRASDKARYECEAERRRASASIWWRENRDRHYANVHQRKLRVRRATPVWLTEGQREQMTRLYVEARNRPGEWHVDHIEPLCGKTSCGLHVPWNLQIMTGDANRRKGNALETRS